MKFFLLNSYSHGTVVGKDWFNIAQQYVQYRYSNGSKLWYISFACFLFVFILSSQQAFAQSIRLTIYDDGRSCPANCDAHVVFHRTLNGTIFAHDPGSSSASFKKCVINTQCQICFDDRSNSSCMTAMYRGNGPHPDTFDFTPEFYKQNCSTPSIPSQLKQQCQSLAAAARTLNGRINCIANPNDPKCIALMKTANSLQANDQPLYDKCKREGESNFNRNRPIDQQRSNDCAYEKKGTGGSGNRTWKRLLPGACRPGTYVGRDGLDCCSGYPFADGPLGVECRGFYQR